MSTLTINGRRVTSASITFPMFGAWAADVVLADAPELATTAKGVSLVVADLTIVGTVVRQGSFAGSLTARIVGGAAGWRTELPAKGYSHAVGVKLSSVLDDAARENGETFATSPDRQLGSHWVRERAKGEALLSILLDGEWWIDAAGVTQMAARDASAIVTPFTVINWQGGLGSFEIAAESLAAWQPGRTFSAPTVPATQTISSVTVSASNEGKLRLHVLSADSAIERLRADLRAIVRAELAWLSYGCVWEYTIVSGTSSTVDARPTDARMPAITKCPMMPGLLGESVTPTPGTKCRVVFVNGDPSRPECIGIDGDPMLASIAGGVLGVARMADTVQAGPFGGVITSGSLKVSVG